MEMKVKFSNEEFKEVYHSLWEETWHRNETQLEYEERIRNKHQYLLKYPKEAFNKEESQKRYNPKENEKTYFTKQELEKNSDSEKWVFLSNAGYTKYAVSDNGRVAYNTKAGYKIIEQDDVYCKGYLRLDPKGDYNLDHDIEVYKLIAMGFLGKTIGDCNHVHHRINDGYNCQPENLILLTKAQHNAVHCKEEISDLMEYLKDE